MPALRSNTCKCIMYVSFSKFYFLFLKKVECFVCLIFWSSKSCYIPNIKALGLVISDKKIFKVFISFDLDKQWAGCLEAIENLLKQAINNRALYF